MANNFSAALVTDVARETGIMVLQARLAALKAFSKDFSADELAPLKRVQVPLVTAGATALIDPTNFESGDSVMTNIPVAVHEISVPFNISNTQYNQGFRLKSLYQINLAVLANAIIDAAMTPITVANYGAPTVAAVPASNFGTEDLTLLFSAAKNFNTKNLVLDGSYLAQFIPTDKFKFALGESGAFGFDMITENNRWNGAGPNVQGFVADPQALALASGLPIMDPEGAKEMIIDEVIDLPELGMSIKFNVWFSRQTRTLWGSYGVMFGASQGDTTALKLITSA